MGLNKHIFFLLLVLLLSTAHQTYAQANKDRREIRKALRANDRLNKKEAYSESVKFYDSNTIQFWSDILHAARFADSTELMQLEYSMFVWVIDTRAHTSSDSLKVMDGTALLTHNLKYLRGGRGDRFTIGDIMVNGDTAKARILDYKYPTPYFYEFYKIEGQWYFNWAPVYDYINSLAKMNLAKENYIPTNKYYIEFAEEKSLSFPGFDPWKPKGKNILATEA